MVNGIKLYAFQSMDELIDYSIDKHKILIAINARKIVRKPDLKDVINDNIGYADGIGPKLAIRRKTNVKAAKLPGCEIWLKLIERYYSKKKFYFVGGTSEAINATIAKLKHDFPCINIAGYRNGYIKTKNEKSELINQLKLTKPDVVFVAMGSPLQEHLMKELLIEYPALYQGLGGSFDVYIGKKKRAPKLLIKFGMEGVFYTINEGLKNPKERIGRFLQVLKLLIRIIFNKI